MSLTSVSATAASREIEREVLVLKKQHDVAKDVGAALVDLVQDVPKPPPGRIDTYA